jgi:ribosomal protein S18 acetylase RimI-like enzyme
MRITAKWTQEDREYIRTKLIEYNLSQLPEEVNHPMKPISFLLRDEQDQIVGGITGTMFWQCMHVDFLWLEESLRGKGYGKQLLAKMEEAAKEHSCRLIQLDTFSFQAPDFYQRNGYEVIGIVDGYPTELHKRYYLVKRLEGERA